MARPEKLIEPINNAKFEDVARSLLKPKKKPEEKKPEKKDSKEDKSTAKKDNDK